MNAHDLEDLFSTQWEGIIEKSRLSLEPNDLHSLDALVSWDAVRMVILDLPGENLSSEFALAKPSLGHLSSFTHIFETELSPKLSSSFLWGVIGILIQVAFESQEATRTTLRMLRSIGYKADTFNACYAALPHVVNQIKEACFDIMIELVEFGVDAIKCLRGDNDSSLYQNSTHFGALVHATPRQDYFTNPVEQMEKRYASVNLELEKILGQVERLVQFNMSLAIRAQPVNPDAPRTLAMQDKKPSYFLLPQTRTLRFFDRVDIFTQLENVLGNEPWAFFKSIALWGLGGIGKSSIALRYLEIKVGQGGYDAMLWVHAEKDASLRQSFTDIALKLKLPEAHPQAHDQNLAMVQDWLQSTDCRWLLVYDNVPSLGMLTRYWPVARQGHVIITTRSSSVAFHQASVAIEVTSWDVKLGSEFLLFLLQQEIGKDIEEEGISAQELSRRLSGHALGISHIAGLIHRRSWTISEFMKIYLSNPRRVHGSEFQALWDFSFRSMNAPTHAFLGVLSFLMPDNIPQSLFETRAQLPKALDFCSDEFSFYETVEGLLEVSLIKRNRDTRAFSIHRMIQTQFRYFLKQSQLQRSFEDAVYLIYQRFPKMGKDDKGQLYDQWAQCNALLQHVIYLKDCFKACRSSEKNFKASLEFCELLTECQRYLYESNAFNDLEDMCSVNLIAVGTLDNQQKIRELLPHIYSQQANMYESLGNVKKAIELNTKGYQIRLDENPIKQPLCYGFEANLGYTYNTANDHKVALEWFEKARNRWVKFVNKSDDKSSYPTVLKKNIARCFVHMGNLSEARSLLDTAIAEFKINEPFNWGMVAFAYQVMGLIDRKEGNLEASEANLVEAQNFWRQGDQARLHPFYGGCLYKTGAVCLDEGKTEAAVKYLRDSLDITGLYKDTMPVEHTRSCFKLSEALLQDNPRDTTEADELRMDAEIFLRRRDAEATDFSSEAAYDKFVPIFWR
ncbi:pfs domain-containing protein [Xylaria curta]|nr:pfs domain-containing protein [Xylaria curta]